MKQRAISTAIWVLGTIVAATLLVAVVTTLAPWCFSTAGPGVGADKLRHLSAIAISAGVFIAILTFARERQKVEADRIRQTSKVLLDRASEAFDTAIRLLHNKNNSRVIWVRAARTLRRAIELGEQIRDPDYQRAYELETERARNDLYDALTVESEETGERSPLPPQFFYGISDWKDGGKSLDEAAIAASNEVEVYSPSLNELPPQSSLRPLSVRSVVAIFDFLEYPEEYEDPLDRVEDWSSNWDKSHGPDQGARRYVAHAKQKYAVGGKLHERERGANDS